MSSAAEHAIDYFTAMSIADRIRRRRMELGMTVRGLGKIVGVSGSAVSQWESGGTIKPENQAALSHALGISIIEFLPPGSLVGDVVLADSKEKLLVDRFRKLSIPMREAYLRMLVVQADQEEGRQ